MANVKHDSEWSNNLIARIILSIIGLVFFLYVVFGPKSGDVIDKPFLADHFTGNVADIIGTILFLIGLVWFSGLGTKIMNSFSSSTPETATSLDNAGKPFFGLIFTLVGLLLIFFV